MKNKTKIIIATSTATVIAGSSVITYHHLKSLNEQNKRLKIQLENLQDDSNIEKYDALDTIYSKILEINRYNLDLIVYEGKAQEYHKTITDNRLIESKVRLSTSYSYIATIDLHDIEVKKCDDYFLVFVDISKIQLSDIIIDPMAIHNDLNVLNRWKGVTISEMTSSIMKQATSDIENHVKNDYSKNYRLIQNRAKEKVNSLYKGMPVKVIFVDGDANE